MQELRVLECRSCALQRINTQIYHLLPYLSHLDLGNNRIQFLTDDEFIDLKRLHSLWLDGNQLPVVLERTFVNQQQLHKLCLARNRLAKITNAAFLNLTSLVELDIGYNKLSSLEAESMQPIAESVQKLIFSGNRFPISVIKIAVQVVHRVVHLEIADMGISEVPSGFLPDRVKHLNVSGNNLSSLQALPQQLVELDISRNKFRGLEERVILRMERLKKVHHWGNPWTCDLCHMGSMVSRVNHSKLFHDVTCASPPFLKGRLLDSMDLEELSSCDGESSDDFVSFLSDHLGVVIGSACLFVFLAFCVAFVICSCLRRRTANVRKRQKRVAETEATLENTSAMFSGKSEISFKFGLDLTERRVSVSTIDDIKRETQLHNLPNGTGI